MRSDRSRNGLAFAFFAFALLLALGVIVAFVVIPELERLISD